jgi:nitroreductase
MTTFLNRESQYPILQLFLSRISYRAFSEERLTEEELFSLFEAARWAPSSYNNQPWRFVYVRRGDREWDTFFNVLIDFNKSWCHRADTLVLVVCKNDFEHNNKPSKTARFDTGAAWMSLAVEASARNIVAHAMQGFDYDAIKKELHISDVFTIEAMIAIGKKEKEEDLFSEVREKEIPSTRKSLDLIVSRGSFTFV